MAFSEQSSGSIRLLAQHGLEVAVVFTLAATLLNIPVFRQITGLLAVLFLPGYSLTNLLVKNCDQLEKIVFSVAFSIGISGFTAIAINAFTSISLVNLVLVLMLITLTFRILPHFATEWRG